MNFNLGFLAVAIKGQFLSLSKFVNFELKKISGG